MPDTHGIQAAPEKIVVAVAGRQRVGKTALLRACCTIGFGNVVLTCCGAFWC